MPWELYFSPEYCHDLGVVTVDGVRIDEMDLLTTYTQD
jgi:hypothetical protein